MTVTLLTDTRVKARKHHRCFHCYRHIPPGQVHRVVSLVNEGRPYRLREHDDCRALWDAFEKNAGPLYFDDDGTPPLLDYWQGGDFQILCNEYRGYFPHAVTRLESWSRAQ